MPRAHVGDLTLHYETAGSGTPVLLVMGFCIRGAGWRFQVPALSAHHEVCVYDNRGCGTSDTPAPGYPITAMADDAVRLMDHLDWPNAHVVGVSMGGMIAQHIALEHRERTRSLVLIATSAGGMFGRLPTFRGLPHVLSGSLRRNNRQATLASLTKLLFPRAIRDELGTDWIHQCLDEDLTPTPTPEGRKGQLKAVFGHNTRQRLQELTGVPTLVVKPELDQLVRPSESEYLHRSIPGSRIVRLEGVGHGLVRHAGARLSEPLLKHFSSVDNELS